MDGVLEPIGTHGEPAFPQVPRVGLLCDRLIDECPIRNVSVTDLLGARGTTVELMAEPEKASCGARLVAVVTFKQHREHDFVPEWMPDGELRTTLAPNGVNQQQRKPTPLILGIGLEPINEALESSNCLTSNAVYFQLNVLVPHNPIIRPESISHAGTRASHVGSLMLICRGTQSSTVWSSLRGASVRKRFRCNQGKWCFLRAKSRSLRSRLAGTPVGSQFTMGPNVCVLGERAQADSQATVRQQAVRSLTPRRASSIPFEMVDRGLGYAAALALIAVGCGDAKVGFGDSGGAGGSAGASSAGSGGSGNGGSQTGGSGGAAGSAGKPGAGCGPIGTCPGEWVHQFGGIPGWDDSANGAAIDAEGNGYIAGTVYNATPGAGVSGGLRDDFIRAYSPTGDELWARVLTAEEGSEQLSALKLDAQGNMYIAGTLSGLLDGEGSKAHKTMYLRKLSMTGSVLWTRVFGAVSQNDLFSLDCGPDGSPFVVGTVAAALPGQTYAGGSDAFILKHDASGNVAWTRQFTHPFNDFAYAVAVDASGNAYMGGLVTDGMPGFDTKPGDVDGFVRKYSSSGEELWTVPIATDDRDQVLAIAIDPSGDVIVTGTTHSAFPGFTNTGNNDIFVSKLSSDGSPIWTRQFGSDRSDKPHALEVDETGAVYVAGETFGSLTSEPSASDGFVARLESNGTVTWIRQLSPSEPEGLAEIDGIAVGAGAAFVVGRVRGSLPGQTGTDDFDVFIARMTL